MSAEGRVSGKRRLSSLSGFGALKSFKVPKKSLNKSLLESINVESSDYVDEILPQIQQSCRFPQISSYLQVDQAWLVHNRVLEEAFQAARKRLHKGNTNVSADANLGTGFFAVHDWSAVEKIAGNGISPGNDPHTWLGKPELGVAVNQCADLTVARAQNRIVNRSSTAIPDATTTVSPLTTTTPIYLFLLRWVKSRAYIVSTEAENSDELLEPQPSYTCHVSTWSRIDPLDPSKLSLERAFQLAQVYLYEFDEELELRPKPEHVIPYAVVKCRWELNTGTAESLSAAAGSILVLSLKPARKSVSSRSSLLPTPPKSSYGSRSFHTTSEDSPLSRSLGRQIKLSGDDPVPLPSITTQPKHKSRLHSSTHGSSASMTSPPLSTNLISTDKVIEDKLNTPMHSMIMQARRLSNQTEWISRLGEPSSSSSSSNATISGSATVSTPTSQPILIGTSLMTWGDQPQPDNSFALDLYAYQRSFLPIFDGIMQPCLHISRLVSHTSLHYELAGLTPWASKQLEPDGPPVLVSIPRDQEWCLPRLNETTAASLQCDPSPFSGYRGNYLRLALAGSGRRTEMSQFCDALREKAMAAVVHIPCDESSVLFLFPDCQFSRSINLSPPLKSSDFDVGRALSRLRALSFLPSDSLDTNYLHGILLTPHSLERYPYARVVCSDLLSVRPNESDKIDELKPESVNTPRGTYRFLQGTPVTAPSELLFGQRKSAHIPSTDTKMKIPLDALLSALRDGGKELLGTAFIAILASQRGTENAETSRSLSSPSSKVSPQRSTTMNDPRTDPRLKAANLIDTQAPSDGLSPTVSQNSHLFNKSTNSDVTLDHTNKETSTNLVNLGSEPKNTVAEPFSFSPPAPTSPVHELDSVNQNIDGKLAEPKVIPLENNPPLSCSSPTSSGKTATQAIVEKSVIPCQVATESMDMEIESHGHDSHNASNMSLADSSDMEVETPSVRFFESPFKIRYQALPATPHTSDVSFSPRASVILKEFRNPDRPGPSNSSELRSPHSGKERINLKSPALCVPLRNDGILEGLEQESTKLQSGTLCTSSPKNRSAERDGPLPCGTTPTNTSALAHQSSVLYKPVSDDGNRRMPQQDRCTEFRQPCDSRCSLTDPSELARHQIRASPRLVLEDIAQTHPYYFQRSDRAAVDESEEGEIVDDENEMDESEDGATASVDRHLSDYAYSCVSSDISSNTSLNVVDEWHTSSAETSFSHSSPQWRSHRRHSGTGNNNRSSLKSKPLQSEHRGRLSDSAPEQPRTIHVSRSSSQSCRRRHSLLGQPPPKPTHLKSGQGAHHSSNCSTKAASKLPCEEEFKLVDQIHSSAENSDQSLWDAETSLEDEDMRIPQATGNRYNRHSNPKSCILGSDVRATREHPPTLFPTRSDDTREEDPNDHSHVLGSQDVDYRRLPPQLSPAHVRHSHRDYPTSSQLSNSCRKVSPTNIASDQLPRYSVYHPKQTHSRDYSRNMCDSATSRPRSGSVTEHLDGARSHTGGFGHHRGATAGTSADHRGVSRANNKSRSRQMHSSCPSADPNPKRRTMFRKPPLIPPSTPPAPLQQQLPASSPIGLLPTAHQTLPFASTVVPTNLWSLAQVFTQASNILQPPPQPWK